MHLRGKAMMLEAILPSGQKQVISLVSDFNFNWMTTYVYADDVAPLLPKGTILKVDGVARQHDRQEEQSRSESVGRLGRSHGGRNGPRLDQHRLHEGRRLQDRTGQAPRDDDQHHRGRAAAVNAAPRETASGRRAQDGHLLHGPALSRAGLFRLISRHDAIVAALIVALVLMSWPPSPAAAQVTVEPAAPRWGQRTRLPPSRTTPRPRSSASTPAITSSPSSVAFTHGSSTLAAGADDLGRPSIRRASDPAARLRGGVRSGSHGSNDAVRKRAPAVRLPHTRGHPAAGRADRRGSSGADAIVAAWQADVAADLAALGQPPTVAGRTRWCGCIDVDDRVAFTPDVFRHDVERVEREETNRTAGLLSSARLRLRWRGRSREGVRRG